MNLFIATAKSQNAPQINVVVLLLCSDQCGCINCKNNNIQEQVDVNKIFNDDDDFSEYQDEDTNGEADNFSDSSKDKLFDDYEIDND